MHIRAAYFRRPKLFTMKNVIIIGGGAAGMMAAAQLAKNNQIQVTLIEQNEKLGKKLFITGKGRCNLTNNTEPEELLSHTVTNAKFMYSAFSEFQAQDVMRFFEETGLRLKTERGNRVFPESDHSSDVIKALEKQLYDVDVRLNTRVCEILWENYAEDEGKYTRRVTGVIVSDRNGRRETLSCDAVLLATGGYSYPQTGATGDGYTFCDSLGLKLISCRPALVPFEIEESCCHLLMGLTLKNVEITCTAKVKNKKKVLYKDFGELLFTHFGVSGPVILSASSYIGKYISEGVTLHIDLKPALSTEQLDARLLRDFEASKNKQLKNSMSDLLPKSMIPVVIDASGVSGDTLIHDLTREERAALVSTLKDFTLTVAGTRGFDEAIITQGGVSVKEINPKTMEAKTVKGLYLAGELIDIDAVTGGFNLQLAWSTAYAAAQGIINSEVKI